MGLSVAPDTFHLDPSVRFRSRVHPSIRILRVCTYITCSHSISHSKTLIILRNSHAQKRVDEDPNRAWPVLKKPWPPTRAYFRTIFLFDSNQAKVRAFLSAPFGLKNHHIIVGLVDPFFFVSTQGSLPTAHVSLAVDKPRSFAFLRVAIH